MRYQAGLLLAFIFAALALLHLYWAAGGSFGSAVSVPMVDGKRAFNPSPMAALWVAAALFMAMLVILGQLRVWGSGVPQWIFYSGTWTLCLLFFIRAIGNFKLVGFCKQVHDTDFAYWDTRLFSPLCLLISVLAFSIAIKKN
ncbi:MAG: DUF3995 domain-containing protein [Acidobacteria bacterium]|nr:DUF3995 domain-containing protein [Acidobacteriota bacterium]